MKHVTLSLLLSFLNRASASIYFMLFYSQFLTSYSLCLSSQITKHNQRITYGLYIHCWQGETISRRQNKKLLLEVLLTRKRNAVIRVLLLPIKVWHVALTYLGFNISGLYPQTPNTPKIPKKQFQQIPLEFLESSHMQKKKKKKGITSEWNNTMLKIASLRNMIVLKFRFNLGILMIF